MCFLQAFVNVSLECPAAAQRGIMDFVNAKKGRSVPVSYFVCTAFASRDLIFTDFESYITQIVASSVYVKS